MQNKPMSDKVRGYLFVTAQFALLGALMLPGGKNWPVELWLRVTSWVFIGVGLVLILVAGLNLGKSLTANPVPLAKAQLKTTGLYAVVRHPIYLGLLVLAAGMTAGSGSVLHIVFAAALFAILNFKAAFEERLLRAKFAEYAEYAAKVGRLLPRLFGRHLPKGIQ